MDIITIETSFVNCINIYSVFILYKFKIDYVFFILTVSQCIRLQRNNSFPVCNSDIFLWSLLYKGTRSCDHYCTKEQDKQNLYSPVHQTTLANNIDILLRSCYTK